MPIRDKGTGTEDNSICFSNKPVTVRIWRRSSRPHGGPDAAPQLQKQLALHHFSEIISRSAAPAVCCILTRGAIAALRRVSPASLLAFHLCHGLGPCLKRNLEATSPPVSVLPSQGWDQGQDAGPHHRAWWKEHWVRSKGPGF